MHAAMRPDGSMVLIIERAELPDVEDALTLFEDVAKQQAGDDSIDADEHQEISKLAALLDNLCTALTKAEGRSRHRRHHVIRR
jgi:hypothetical protein